MASPNLEKDIATRRTLAGARLEVSLPRLRYRLSRRKALGYTDVAVNFLDLEMLLEAAGAKVPA